jgi:nucleoside-diphosphate-sugar epimerase
MRDVVTGVAGFVGSHLAESLLAAGREVLGVDCLTDYYDRDEKMANLSGLLGRDAFSFLTLDLRDGDLVRLLRGADVVYHQAGQPGVRLSWSTGFPDYVGHNVLATQRLLEAARIARCRRVVYASSSSVYGERASFPSRETDLPHPHSPYGVTKLAAEHLCSLYADNWGVPTVSLRYFTVYGPRQRPDMAIRRLVDAALSGTPFQLFGDGSQVRDFTFVGDVVAANVLAGTAELPPGTVLNIAGGSSVRLDELIRLVEDLAGSRVALEHLPAKPGDVSATGGSTEEAARLLGWSPATSLETGITAQLAWARRRLASDPGARRKAMEVAS